jgi:hypothetical protein
VNNNGERGRTCWRLETVEVEGLGLQELKVKYSSGENVSNRGDPSEE